MIINNTMAVYIAVFGRPADPEGFLWFSNETKGGTDFSTIGNITGTPEYQRLYAQKSPAETISSLYHELFDRVPEDAEMAFWAMQLETGALTVENIAVNIAMAAQGIDRETLANKTMASHNFMAALDTQAERTYFSGDQAEYYMREWLDTVTNDPATIWSEEVAQVNITAYIHSVDHGYVIN
ncbi:hypothetical protein DEM27_12470 [Metarhizobium album]|uniref:DUF4214 domain-containing protein n=1 Tax=Metarhizobium album TaxID=2182425 RepID=A0A2U2DSE7_9HYPH|nr:DUF4214 domain-containing protein [Rhizobium album]PWE56234.1 hypothetical protein DEM27_12470 [Rhizobium album]